MNDMDNSLDSYLDSYQDEAWNEFEADLLPYYIYNSRGLIKRHHPAPVTITQACCRKACLLTELVKYCPPK
jgi:hypothetical protein